MGIVVGYCHSCAWGRWWVLVWCVTEEYLTEEFECVCVINDSQWMGSCLHLCVTEESVLHPCVTENANINMVRCDAVIVSDSCFHTACAAAEDKHAHARAHCLDWLGSLPLLFSPCHCQRSRTVVVDGWWVHVWCVHLPDVLWQRGTMAPSTLCLDARGGFLVFVTW